MRLGNLALPFLFLSFNLRLRGIAGCSLLPGMASAALATLADSTAAGTGTDSANGCLLDLSLGLAVILVFALAFLGTLVTLCWKPVEPAPVVDDRKAVALAESLATARAEARHNLDLIAREWDNALERLRRFVED